MPPLKVPDTWSRVVIVDVQPQIDQGRWPIKRTVGESVEVMAGVIADGHEKVAVELIYRHEDGGEQVLPMPLRYNDEYYATFPIEELRQYHYKVRAWLDQFGTWHDQFVRRVEGGIQQQELEVELLAGAALLEKAVLQAKGDDRKRLQTYIQAFRSGEVEAALDIAVVNLARTHDPKERAISSQEFSVAVDPELARFGAWYEFFPRSAREDGQHATLDDAAERLPRIKAMGFDIVYLPPVHPIGETHRKGKDNAPEAQPGDPGSPWAIGGKLEDGTLGGHKSVHPALGGIEAFDRFVARAEDIGLKVSIDIAFQCSPDHPYVQEHPDWFRQRPDGTIRYAENPPKKYQDVYPIDFETEDREGLWNELKNVFEFWIDHGVTIFRVDNPHTKPFAFWEWCIEDLRRQCPELILLSEAFTRPKTMYTLAKLGFNNSYTYFTWRNTKAELEEYGRELFYNGVADFFRPNFWPNTPDILHEYLVHGGRPAHQVRLVLAATMSSAYGLYGPPFEHVDNRQHPAREEYAHNEKYEIRTWNWNDPYSLQPYIQRVNTIRKENPALHYMRNLRFHPTHNDQLLAFSKRRGDNRIVVIANLDPHNAQEGLLELPLGDLDLPQGGPFIAHDLLDDAQYHWSGSQHYIRLNPHSQPAHILRLE